MENYQLEHVNGKYNLYSPKINLYMLENATLDEIKIAIAMEMEYKTKLEVIRLLMTFPDGFSTMDDEIIVHKEAANEFKVWYEEIYQRIGFLDEYYSLIDQKIVEILA